MARKPYTIALVAFICFYVITESRSGGYSSGGGYMGGSSAYMGANVDYMAGMSGSSGYGSGGGTSGEKWVDPVLQQSKKIDDLDFYDVNLLKYSKAVNVMASLVEISFFMVLAAGVLNKLRNLHTTTAAAAK